MSAREDQRTHQTGRRAPGIGLPATILGLGLGGFVDGILLHQVLQWHHMLTNTGNDDIGLDTYPADTVPGCRATDAAPDLGVG